VRVLVKVRNESLSDEALLDDAELVVENSSSLLFTTAMQVNVGGEHPGVRVSAVD